MKSLSLYLMLAAVSLFAIGCEKPNTTKSGSTENHSAGDGHDHSADEHDEHDHAAHDHTAKHGGHLIELGRNHEYHAELVDDHESGSITVYMSDAHLEPLIVRQASISLSLTAGDKTQSFELLAVQPGGDSEFKSSDKAMMDLMETEGVTGKLRVTIDGKPFTGTFDHHDHGADGHEGHDH